MSKNKLSSYSFVLAKMTAIVVLSLSLYGCSGLTKSDKPAINTWWLEPTALVAFDTSNFDQPINVLVGVDVVPGLDTADILTLSPNAELSRFTGARWADELPELIRSLVSRSLESTPGYEVVTRRDSKGLDRCQLRLQVRAFYAELSVTGTTKNIRVSISGEFLCEGSDRRILDFDKRVPVSSDKISAIVAAFQSGLDQAMKELIQQLQHAD